MEYQIPAPNVEGERNLLYLAVDDWLRAAGHYDQAVKDGEADNKQIERLEWTKSTVVPRLNGLPNIKRIKDSFDSEIMMAKSRLKTHNLPRLAADLERRRVAMMLQCDRVDEAGKKRDAAVRSGGKKKGGAS